MEMCGTHPPIAYSPLDPKKPQLSGVVRSYENRKTFPGAELVLTQVEDPQINTRTVANGKGRFGFEKRR